MPQTTPTTRALVSDSWMHCFVGSHETQVRWAYDPTHDHLAAQAKSGLGWDALQSAELADLRDELEDNDILAAPEANDDVRVALVWPTWAGLLPSTLRQDRTRGRAPAATAGR